MFTSKPVFVTSTIWAFDGIVTLSLYVSVGSQSLVDLQPRGYQHHHTVIFRSMSIVGNIPARERKILQVRMYFHIQIYFTYIYLMYVSCHQRLVSSAALLAIITAAVFSCTHCITATSQRKDRQPFGSGCTLVSFWQTQSSWAFLVHKLVAGYLALSPLVVFTVGTCAYKRASSACECIALIIHIMAVVIIRQMYTKHD